MLDWGKNPMQREYSCLPLLSYQSEWLGLRLQMQQYPRLAVVTVGCWPWAAVGPPWHGGRGLLPAKLADLAWRKAWIEKTCLQEINAPVPTQLHVSKPTCVLDVWNHLPASGCTRLLKPDRWCRSAHITFD